MCCVILSMYGLFCYTLVSLIFIISLHFLKLKKKNENEIKLFNVELKIFGLYTCLSLTSLGTRFVK